MTTVSPAGNDKAGDLADALVTAFGTLSLDERADPHSAATPDEQQVTTKSASQGEDAGRLTFNELKVAVLGVILGRWQVPPESTRQTLQALLQLLSPAKINNSARLRDRWPLLLAEAIELYFQDESAGSAMLALGRQRQDFIPKDPFPPEHPCLFALDERDNVFSLIEAREHKLMYLRKVLAEVASTHGTEAFLAVKQGKNWHLEMASSAAAAPDADPIAASEISKAKKKSAHSSWNPLKKGLRRKAASQSQDTQLRIDIDGHCLFLYHGTRAFRYLLGDVMEGAAIYALHDETKPGGGPVFSFPRESTGTLDDVLWCVRHEAVSTYAVTSHFETVDSDMVRVLQYLSYASILYASLRDGGASVSPHVLADPCYTPDLLDSLDCSAKYGFRELWRIIEAIAYFETGSLFLLKNHTAKDRLRGLAVGDSIYVLKAMISDPTAFSDPQLLADPEREKANLTVRQIRGSLGESGAVFLVRPETLQPADQTNNVVISSFDGTKKDSFSNTSLRLHIKDWSGRVYTTAPPEEGDRGAIVAEVVVSVYDADRWVADIDPASAL